MRLSGTFLHSRVARRIAIILFIAAFIPTALITGLTQQTLYNLVKTQSHTKLVDVSHNYALTVFSHLVFARDSLLQLSASIDLLRQLENGELNSALFRSMLLVKQDGRILDKHGLAEYYSPALYVKNLRPLISTLSNVPQLVVLPGTNENVTPTLVMVLLRKKGDSPQTMLIAEISGEFLWGTQSDYPSDILTCAYRTNPPTKIKLSCLGSETQLTGGTELLPENRGSWELFLNAAFHENSWLVETTRTNPIATNGLVNFISGYSYVGVALGSLLMVALLSLIQIRRTMLPLEMLIDGTRKITKGDFTPVQVKEQSEFGELAGAFNAMTTHIKKQLDTQQALSLIDREIVSKLDVDRLIDLVMERVRQLKPHDLICNFRLNENPEGQTHCNVRTLNNAKVAPRISISGKELNAVKSYGLGHISFCKTESKYIHESLLAGLGANFCWVLPIFWQKQMCAFFVVGSEEQLHEDDPYWDEIREFVSRIGIVIAAQDREYKLLLQAQYDSLTGLPNRVLLQDRLQEAIKKANRIKLPFAVMLLDLDRFKEVNDTLGHDIGDILLMEVAKRLNQCVREEDAVARFGGDEFIVIISELDDPSNIDRIAHNILQKLAEPFQLQNEWAYVSASLGITLYPQDSETIEGLLKNADQAMYLAKNTGRNRFSYFTKSMQEAAHNRMRLANDLRNALTGNQFRIYYQPIIELTTGTVHKAEALIRWQHRERGLVSPAEFIPIAEDTGMISEIGNWVFKEAAQQVKNWRKFLRADFEISVNMSPVQFRNEVAYDSWFSYLRELGLPGQSIIVEITEGLLLDVSSSVSKYLLKFRDAGIQVALDDFGTGYSSLSYLKKFDIDYLKIDQSFVRNLMPNSDDLALCEAIIMMAHKLGIKVIAEGIETAEQLDLLRAINCDYGQGYLFSKPIPAEEFEHYIQVKK